MGKQTLSYVSTLIGIIALAVLVYAAYDTFSKIGGVVVPELKTIRPENRFTLNKRQGWPDGWDLNQAQWFHHASQGTRILPRAWFINLQQPSLDPSVPKIVEGDYLQRFGFLPSTIDKTLNPDGLPIGFAIDWEFDAPYARPPWKGPVVGLTCAACHTGQIQVQDSHGVVRSVRIEGGSAMINVSAFQTAIGVALAYTVKSPTRLNRFSHDVLGDAYNDKAKRSELEQQLNAFLDTGLKYKQFEESHKLTGTDGGFGRTDALSLIGNRVFRAIGNENLVVPLAPVNFPPLWDTSWFDWVQYNGSIRMPMVRNIGEALGVGAPVDLNPRSQTMFASTVNVKNLHLLEEQLGGDKTLEGLKPPRWCDLVDLGVLPALEPALVFKGGTHYKTYCQSCHLPPMDQFRAFLKGEPFDQKLRPELEAHLILEDVGGPTRRILRLELCDLQQIGTDANQALNFYRRVAIFRGQTTPATLGLFTVTEFIRRQKYRLLDIPATDPVAAKNEGSLKYNRYRKFDAPTDESKVYEGFGMDKVLVANLKYRARPLDGIWATPPFLHNGSVPSLDQLLRPVEQRDKTFYLGTTMFDTRVVGYRTEQFSGGFKLETCLQGNTNTGHEFRNLTLTELESVPELWPSAAPNCPPDTTGDEATRWARVLGLLPEKYIALTEPEQRELVRVITGKALGITRVKQDHPFRGVIGAELTDEDRLELVEYIKSL